MTRSAAGVSDPQLVTTTAATRDAAPAPERVPQPLGERMLNLHQASPEQNARQLSQQVQVMVSQDLQQADIRLNPSELGGMRIQLRFEQGELSMHIQAQHPQARELLEQAMPRLRDMLGQQGIQLGQGQVGGFAGQQGGAQNGASGQDATGREGGIIHPRLSRGRVKTRRPMGPAGRTPFSTMAELIFLHDINGLYIRAEHGRKPHHSQGGMV
ncbi:flagellar hook-length control protein FliK [Oceanimonas sp. NS1]|nr:flagellar hook-length control protein FliK [Oceanimonas sp. NS1]